MKRMIAVFVAVIFLMTTAPVFALPAMIDNSITKLKDGTVKIIKSPLKLHSYTVDEMDNSDFKPMGFIGGLFKGTGHMVHEIGLGVVDVVTFPFDLE